MSITASWPDGQTLIPDLLEAAPHVRPILDRYGLHGCGGPSGPRESLAFFARAHDVPVDRLLAEIRGAALLPPAPTGPPAPTSDKPQLADTIYRPFFKAGIAVVLTLGAAWGAWLLVQIAWRGSFATAGLHEINAHGHAQIFGWVALFVMGFAYQAFPRFKHASLKYPRLAYATLPMMLAGLIGRSAAQPFATEAAWAWWLGVSASLLEIIAAFAFVAVIIATWRSSGKGLIFYDYYIASALGWFIVQAVYESLYLTATASLTGDELARLVSTWQLALRDVQIHGFALLMILGVSQRIFHHFYGLPMPRARLSLGALAVLNLAVGGEAGGKILAGLISPVWRDLSYASSLVLGSVVVVLVWNWRIFSRAEDPDRSLKFLRAAYIWLFVSLVMLALGPFYLSAVQPWSGLELAAVWSLDSHAYYGAARHAITVGFVSLMIMGVAAKVVPTLGGIDGRELSFLWAPFVLINAGCTLRVVGQTLTDIFPISFRFTGASGLFEVTALALWGGHLWLIMAGRARRRSPVMHSPKAATLAPGAPILAGHTVGEVLDQYPHLLDTFVSFGFTMLTNMQMRKTVARVVTIERACRRTGVDSAQLLIALNGRARSETADIA